MLAKGNLYRVENLDKNDDQENSIEKHHYIFGQLPMHQVLNKVNDFCDEQRTGDASEQQTEADINRILKKIKAQGKPATHGSIRRVGSVHRERSSGALSQPTDIAP